jgi:hypothetical protein
MTLPSIEWDTEPTLVKIALEPHHIRGYYFFESDIVIVREIGGERFEAVVPTATLGVGNSYVPAARVGKVNGKILLYLPTGNDGRPAWRVDEDALNEVLVD